MDKTIGCSDENIVNLLQSRENFMTGLLRKGLDRCTVFNDVFFHGRRDTCLVIASFYEIVIATVFVLYVESPGWIDSHSVRFRYNVYTRLIKNKY